MLEKHVQRTNGEGKEIHEFLDQFHVRFGIDHRKVFHHKEGIQILVNLFGEEARAIAEKHIKDDLYGDMFDGGIPSCYDGKN